MQLFVQEHHGRPRWWGFVLLNSDREYFRCHFARSKLFQPHICHSSLSLGGICYSCIWKSPSRVVFGSTGWRSLHLLSVLSHSRSHSFKEDTYNKNKIKYIYRTAYLFHGYDWFIRPSFESVDVGSNLILSVAMVPVSEIFVGHADPLAFHLITWFRALQLRQ